MVEYIPLLLSSSQKLCRSLILCSHPLVFPDSRWSAIAARLPGRTDNEIKNYWNTHIRKRLLRMGIDPVTHNPRLDLLDLSSILYSSSQINLTRLLGLQPQLVNPELLRLPSSLISSSHRQNPNFLLQNVRENQLCNLENQVQNQLPPLIQNTQIQDIPFSNDQAQLMQPNVEQFTNFNSQNCQSSDWQCNEIPSNVNDQFIPLQNCSLFESDRSIMENSGFQSNNFSFASNSNSPLNSNSTYINSSSTTIEDERESYCSNMMKFEIPDILDVNCFM